MIPQTDRLTKDNNECYRRVIENIDNLPSLPAIVTRLMQVVNSPDTSAEDAAELIENDPALTSKMIRLANSAFYGIPRSISSVSSAVVILGFNTIRSLVLSASVMKTFASVGKVGVDKDLFWKHSIVTAIAAKITVRHFINVRMMDPESAFCAGMLHDIGKLIFNEFVPDAYLEACEYAKKNSISLFDAEKKVLGMTHAEIGRILADKWALPLDLEYALVYHHNPDSADKFQELVTIIHFADQLAHQLGASLWEKENIFPEWLDCKNFLHVTEPDLNQITLSLKDSLEKSYEFFNIIK